MSASKPPRGGWSLAILLVGLGIGVIGVCLAGTLLFRARISGAPAPLPAATPRMVSAATPTTAPADTAVAATPVPPAPADTPTTIPTVELGTSNVFIEYILDASGSMTETLSDGVPKIEVAKRVLTDHMRSFRPETNIGLRAYGHRLPYRQEAESCKDIELVAPVEKGEMERIVGFLQDFKAQGMTPLAASLQQAKDDFVFEAPRVNSIVMLSDGIETCGGDPCQLVEDLKAQGINFTIHVIGLDVDNPTREQLSCIAAAGGGAYRDANSQQDLAKALGAVKSDVTKDEVVVPPGVDTPTPVPPTLTPISTPTPTMPASVLAGKIVFLSSRDYSDYRTDMPVGLRPHDIYMMNPDGSDQIRITQGLRLTNMSAPIVSPDGLQIAIGARNDDIRILDADGSITSSIDNPGNAAWLHDWSSSGVLLLTAYLDSPNFSGEEIYSLDLASGQYTRLTNDTRHNLYATWSPDGRRIAYMSDYELWIMNADGSDQRRLIEGEARDLTWSPDGTKIAFESQDVPGMGTDYDLWIVNADGTEKQRVTTTPGLQIYNPSWSPDGTTLAFVGYPNGPTGEGQVFVVDIVSGAMTQLTTAGNNFEVYWVNGK